MKILSIFGLNNLPLPFRRLVYVIISSYIISMFLFPIWKYWGSLDEMFLVWDRWQSLNVGMIAFISSVVVLNINHSNNREKNRQKLTAAIALLPLETNRLTDYHKICIMAYIESLQRFKKSDDNSKIEPLKSDFPLLPESHTPVFKECIEFSEVKMGQVLAQVLSENQINSARLKSLFERHAGESKIIFGDTVVYGNMALIAITQAKIFRLLNFARGQGEFDFSPLSLDETHLAFNQLSNDIVEDYGDFDKVLKSRVERENKSDE